MNTRNKTKIKYKSYRGSYGASPVKENPIFKAIFNWASVVVFIGMILLTIFGSYIYG